MDIVDRLRSMYYELKQKQAFGQGAGLQGIPELLHEASMKIHELQGLTYSYPPDASINPKGVTWREEHDELHRRMGKMSCDDLNDWQAGIGYDETGNVP